MLIWIMTVMAAQCISKILFETPAIEIRRQIQIQELHFLQFSF